MRWVPYKFAKSLQSQENPHSEGIFTVFPSLELFLLNCKCYRYILNWGKTLRQVSMVDDLISLFKTCFSWYVKYQLWSPGWTREDIVWCIEQPRLCPRDRPGKQQTRNPAERVKWRTWNTGAAGLPHHRFLPRHHFLPQCCFRIERWSFAPIAAVLTIYG